MDSMIRLIGVGQPNLGVTKYLQVLGKKLKLKDKIEMPCGNWAVIVRCGKDTNEIECVPCSQINLPTLMGEENVFLLPSDPRDYPEGCLPSKSGLLNVKPILDRIIIKQSEGKKEIEGTSIIIPDSERQKPLVGTVVAAGPGFRNSKGEIVPMTVQVGDLVAYMEHSASQIEIDNVNYVYIKEGDLILIF